MFLRYVWLKLIRIIQHRRSEVAKSVSRLTSIYWIAHAWQEVKAGTIVKCFKTADILTSEVGIVSTDCLSIIDPFGDIDVRMELGELGR